MNNFSANDLAYEFVLSCLDRTASAQKQLRQLHELFSTEALCAAAAQKYVDQQNDAAVSDDQFLDFDADDFCNAIENQCNRIADGELLYAAMRELQSEIVDEIESATDAICSDTGWQDYAADVRATILEIVEIERESEDDDDRDNDSPLQSIIAVLTAAGPIFSGNDSASCADIAQDWLNHQFSADQVQRWINAECWEVHTASTLRAAGFDPRRDKLRYVAGFERDDMTAMYALCNSDRDLDQVCW